MSLCALAPPQGAERVNVTTLLYATLQAQETRKWFDTNLKQIVKAGITVLLCQEVNEHWALYMCEWLKPHGLGFEIGDKKAIYYDLRFWLCTGSNGRVLLFPNEQHEKVKKNRSMQVAFLYARHAPAQPRSVKFKMPLRNRGVPQVWV